MKKLTVEKGQILIILALAIVAIMGFAALAVDGSMVYNEKRKDQSTADSAALAGAGAAAQYLKTANVTGFSCGTSAASNASNAAVAMAQSTAREDAISLAAYNLSTKNGVTSVCGTSNGVPYLDIHTMVSTNAQTSFLKVIRSTPITTTAEAVARVYLNTSFAGGNALVSTGTTCDSNGGIYALGNGHINMTGGGAYSASCLSATGSSKIYAYGGVINYTGAGNLITPQNAQVLILNDIDPTTPPNISDSLAPQIDWYGPNTAIAASLLPTQATVALPALTIPVMAAQDCSGLPTRNPTIDWQTRTIDPGNYPNGIVQSSGALILRPGVYCIAAGKNVTFSQRTVSAPNTIFYFQGAGSLTMSGAVVTSMDNSSIYLTNGNFSVGAGGSFLANNITIYIKQGNFTLDGGAPKVIMNAPGCNTSACGVGPAIPGVLLYMDKTNTGVITVDGGPAPQLNGTMFAPNAKASFSGGTSTTTLNVQLIAKRIEVVAGAWLTMNIDTATLYSQGSTTIELLK